MKDGSAHSTPSTSVSIRLASKARPADASRSTQTKLPGRSSRSRRASRSSHDAGQKTLRIIQCRRRIERHDDLVGRDPQRRPVLEHRLRGKAGAES